MNIDANHDECEKISFSAMYLAVFHSVVIDDASSDCFCAGSILIDSNP